MNDSDYSLLMHNIEERIGSARANEGFANSSIDISPRGSNRKRNISHVPFSTDSSPPLEAFSKKIATSSSYSTTKAMRAEAEIDELRLENERLKDELSSAQDEFTRFKEKAARQLTYLESENVQLKKTATEKVARYYEEKKQWQAKLRAAEAASAASSASNASSSLLLPATAAPALNTKASEDKWKQKLEELEKSVVSKSEEARAMAVANAELEHKFKQLEQQSLSSRLDLGQSGAGDAVESRELRKRLLDAESSLRRKSRELERLEHKVQNQSLLQEENSALKVKLAAMQEIVDSAQSLKTTAQVLIEEKKTWTTIFKEICMDSSALSASSLFASEDAMQEDEVDATPMAALRLLSTAQQKCTLLLRHQGELESARTDLKKQLLRSEATLHECERDKADAAFRAETAEDKLKLAQQQIRLFDGEVKSLRAMVKTFDAEFSIGRPETASVIQMKEETVSAVRLELDACRAQAQSFAAKVAELEEKLSISSKDSVEFHRVCDKLRDELVGLKHATGLDYVPGKTRVLHLAQNPTTAAGLRLSTASTVPMEKMKALQAENKQLNESIANLQAGSAVAVAGVENISADHSMVSGIHAATSAPGSGAAASTDSSKLNMRLKEMFRERITSFREAVYLLTGFKVDLLFTNEAGGGGTLPRLRLRSMYAESPEDSLLFQWRGEVLELMQTPFAERLDHRLLEHLRRCNSVPCFLSSITMELFESQTFQG